MSEDQHKAASKRSSAATKLKKAAKDLDSVVEGTPENVSALTRKLEVLEKAWSNYELAHESFLEFVFQDDDLRRPAEESYEEKYDVYEGSAP